MWNFCVAGSLFNTAISPPFDFALSTRMASDGYLFMSANLIGFVAFSIFMSVSAPCPGYTIVSSGNRKSFSVIDL